VKAERVEKDMRQFIDQADSTTTATVYSLSRGGGKAPSEKKNSRSQIYTRGRSMKTFLLPILALAAVSAQASSISVKAPASGAQLTSPFNLVASATTCGSEPASAMGYSIDYGRTTITKTSFSAMVVAGEGPHVVHVKCWGHHGAADSYPVDINVVPSSSSAPPGITVVSDIQSLPDWKWVHDPGTPGNSYGTSSVTASPSMSGSARQYTVSYSDSGGEMFHSTFGSDTTATHFVYDAEVLVGETSGLANIEMDMNQVMENGDTVIYGVQCDGYSGTWDYTLNIGTPSNPHDTWKHSNVACLEPRNWEPNTWHNVQISYSRDSDGNVTYETVSLDGVQSDFVGATGNSAFRLGWAPTLITNFQLDGLGGEGSIKAYLDKVTVSRW
jgi:hypothetical protein